MNQKDIKREKIINTNGNAEMKPDADQSIKLGERYKKLIGVNLTVDDLDLPVRIRNYLKRSGVHDLQQILQMNGDDMIHAFHAVRAGNESYAYLMFLLEELSKKY